MMMKIANGNCRVYTMNGTDFAKAQDVTYNGQQVYVYIPEGLPIGRYTGAYAVSDNKLVKFGEIKFTVGTVQRGLFTGKYVMCEY